MKFVHQVERSVRVAPRKGVFSIWDVAPNIADDLGYHIKELIPEGIKKIECRFYGATPEFVAIIHSNRGRTFAIEDNSEYLSEDEYEEMGFDPDKYPKISDSIGCVYSPYILAISDIRKEEFLKDHQVSKSELEEIRKRFNDYTADFVL
jgi:hypothetical protein